MFRFLLTHQWWPVVWPYGQADGQWKNCTIKVIPVWGKALWEFKGHIKVGGTDGRHWEMIHMKTVKRILRAKGKASLKSLKQGMVKEGTLAIASTWSEKAAGFKIKQFTRGHIKYITCNP